MYRIPRHIKSHFLCALKDIVKQLQHITFYKKGHTEKTFILSLSAICLSTKFNEEV